MEQANEIQSWERRYDVLLWVYTACTRMAQRCSWDEASAIVQKMVDCYGEECPASEDSIAMLKEALKRADAQLVADAGMAEQIRVLTELVRDLPCRCKGTSEFSIECGRCAALASTAPVAEAGQKEGEPKIRRVRIIGAGLLGQEVDG